MIESLLAMPIRSRSYGWYIVGLLAAVNFLHYGNRNVVFPVYDDLRASFGFSNAELGLLGSVFMLADAQALLGQLEGCRWFRWQVRVAWSARDKKQANCDHPQRLSHGGLSEKSC